MKVVDDNLHPDERPLQRLTTAEYIPLASSVRIYHHLVTRRVEVHWHEFYEMSFILTGEGSHILNGTLDPLTPGSIFLLTPADFHEIIPHPGSTLELYNVIFSDHVLGEELYRILFGEQRGYAAVLRGLDFEVMCAEFRRLWTEAHLRQIGTDLVIQGALAACRRERRCGLRDRGPLSGWGVPPLVTRDRRVVAGRTRPRISAVSSGHRLTPP